MDEFVTAIKLYLQQQFPHFTFQESPDSLYVHDLQNHPEAEVDLVVDGNSCTVWEFDRCHLAHKQRYTIDLNDPDSLPHLGGFVAELLAKNGLFND